MEAEDAEVRTCKICGTTTADGRRWKRFSVTSLEPGASLSLRFDVCEACSKGGLVQELIEECKAKEGGGP